MWLFLDQDYRYKSEATQMYHDVDLALPGIKPETASWETEELTLNTEG